MSTVAIIGAGDIGGALAHALAGRDRVRRILLVDPAAKVAAGKALDIQQSGAIDRFHTRLEGTDELTRIPGCDVCIVADRFSPAQASGSAAEWQGEDGLAMFRTALRFSGNAPFVFAGVAQATLMARAAQELGVPGSRLIGSAPEALVSAITAIVAMEARCSPSEVRLTLLGAPPSGFVVPWGEASMGGYALDQVLEPVQLTRIEARAARLWPPGPYALGAAAARVAESVIGSARRSLAVLTVLNGEFGVRNRVGILPALLSTSGVVHTRTPRLGTRERVLVETALDR